MKTNNNLKSIVPNKPMPFINICEKCHIKFASISEDTKLCIRCQIIEDLILPEDTIVNTNMVNLWKSGKFTKGLDPIFAGVAEGIILLDKKVKRDHLTHLKTFSDKKGNDKIESYIKSLKYRVNGKYDAIIILRFSPKEPFYVFGLKLSERLEKRLRTFDKLFIKGFMVSLVVKHKLKQYK